MRKNIYKTEGSLYIVSLFASLLVLATAVIAQTTRTVEAQQSTSFAVGDGPCSVAFDGSNIWVANSGNNTVSKK